MRYVEKVSSGWYRAYCWGAKYNVLRNLSGLWVAVLDAGKTSPVSPISYNYYPNNIGPRRTLAQIDCDMRLLDYLLGRKAKQIKIS